MIDLKDLRENPDRYRKGAADKQYDPTLIDRLLEVDAEHRRLLAQREALAAEKNRIGKQIGQLAGRIKKAGGEEKAELEREMAQLQQRPAQMKQQEAELDHRLAELEPQRDDLWLQVPLPADADVPVGRGSDDNVEIRHWSPEGFDPARPFADNRGFEPRGHIELMQKLGMVDFERGVKLAGSRSYVLTGDGMLLHNAILQYAFRYMTMEMGFTAMSVPVLVREQCMVGTGFFPQGREQVYTVGDPARFRESLGQSEQADPYTDTSWVDGYLTGTGEVGLMGYHQDEILDADSLPLCYTTVSTCFRREAGAAGKDTAGLFRVHQFDKVEQVVICRADEAESRNWHAKMIGFVEQLLQRLALPYRLLQCCTGDLGPKNADQIDLECWMPSRNGYSETHSASRLYDYQCRRLNIRYRDPEGKANIIAHSLNNTVAASPRLLIPIVEMYQNADGSITIPEVLRPLLNGRERIG